MTERQRQAAKERYQREAEVCCPMCDGSGRILSRTVKARAKKGGNAAYLKSMEPGQMSMSDRGRRGGRPRALTLESLGLRDGHLKEEAIGAPNPTEVRALSTLGGEAIDQWATPDTQYEIPPRMQPDGTQEGGT